MICLQYLYFRSWNSHWAKRILCQGQQEPRGLFNRSPYVSYCFQCRAVLLKGIFLVPIPVGKRLLGWVTHAEMVCWVKLRYFKMEPTWSHCFLSQSQGFLSPSNRLNIQGFVEHLTFFFQALSQTTWIGLLGLVNSSHHELGWLMKISYYTKTLEHQHLLEAICTQCDDGPMMVSWVSCDHFFM